MIDFTYFDQSKMLCGKQLGFRAHHSTDHALVELTDSIFHLFDDRKHTVAIFVHLSKPFDTVQHDILIKNFKSMLFKETI